MKKILRFVNQSQVAIILTKIVLRPLVYFVLLVSHKAFIRSLGHSSAGWAANNKIAFFYYPHTGFIGGDDVVNDQIVDALKAAGFHVDVFKRDDWLATPVSAKDFIGKWIFGTPYLASRKISEVAGNYALIIVTSGVSFSVLHPNQVNLYHYSFTGYRQYAGVKWGAYALLQSFRNEWIDRQGSIGVATVAVSDFLKEELNKNNIHVDRVIHNGIDIDGEFALANGHGGMAEKGLLYAGGHSYYGKGFDILEALALKGHSIDCVTNYADETGVLNYLPTVPHHQIREIYSRYKILLYPSRYESFGMVPLEAMAVGLPVVISKVGIGEFVMRHAPEFVVEGYDAEAVDEYEKRINLILSNYEHYSKIARNIAVQHFSNQRFCSEWVTYIRERILPLDNA